MPVLLTVTALTAATAIRSGARAGSAMSPEGEFANAQVTEIWNRFEETFSFQPPHMALFAELEDLVAEHSLPGWDGGDAPAVSYSTAENARAFIAALPKKVSAPELAVDPDDAAISFEWHGGYRKVFSISIGDSGRLACAGLDGTDQWHAALNFGGELPTFVLDSIHRVCP